MISARKAMAYAAKDGYDRLGVAPVTAGQLDDLAKLVGGDAVIDVTTDDAGDIATAQIHRRQR